MNIDELLECQTMENQLIELLSRGEKFSIHPVARLDMFKTNPLLSEPEEKITSEQIKQYIDSKKHGKFC